MNYCEICKLETPACRPSRPPVNGHEMMYCAKCMGVFGRHLWPSGLDAALRSRRRWARLWITWRVNARTWSLRRFFDRLAHPFLYRRLPADLRGLCLADALAALSFSHGRLPGVEAQRMAEMKRAEKAEREAGEARILATLEGVPEYRRLVSSLGFSAEDVH